MELMIVLRMPRLLCSCIGAISSCRERADCRTHWVSSMRLGAGSTGRSPAANDLIVCFSEIMIFLFPSFHNLNVEKISHVFQYSIYYTHKMKTTTHIDSRV